MAAIGQKATPLTYDEVVEALGIRIVPPEENDNLLENVIGLEEVKKYLNQSLEIFKNPNDPKNKKATLYRNFLFVGEAGAGRTMTAFAFAKEANLPIIVINSEKFVSEKPIALVKGLREVLDKHSPAVVLFKKFEYINELDVDKTINVFSKVSDYLNYYSNNFFFASTIPETPLMDVILSKDAFKVMLGFETPTLPQREKLLKRFIADYPHDEDINISKIARDIIGMNAGKISALLSSAYNHALREGKDKIDFESVDTMLSSQLYGYKKSSMTEKERKLTAYHEAGHVIAGYFNNPDYKVSKVEVAHRSESLGLTISEDDENKFSYTKEDYEAQIIECFGGMVAERLLLKTNTSGVAADLAMAAKIAECMVKKYGMSDEFGPVSVIDHESCFYSETLNEQADFIIQSMLKKLYNQTTLLMQKYDKALVALSEALLEKETLFTNEINDILCKFKVES